MSRVYRFFLTLGLLAVLVVSCQPAQAVPTQDTGALMTQAVQTALAEIVTPTPLPTETPLPTPTMAPRTPPALPPVYTTDALKPPDIPHTYISDTCQYLQDKWSPNNAAPGTIVIVIMFHGIIKDAVNIDNPNDITVADFKKLMNSMKDMGFEAINATQLADFLDHNAPIPQRSVVLTYDDRHRAEAFDHFRPYWEQWGWPVVNGWISAFGGQDPFLQENVTLSKEGWVDYEAHGVVHNINMDDNSTDEYITSELQGSITNLQTYFNKTPIAIIWPGGDFGVRPVAKARELGYRVGFTINPRGPIMYNWVPLADEVDPKRPYYLPEGPANDPRLTLPRYWPTQVLSELDKIRVIGNEATAYAEQNKATELEYYDIVCAPTYGALPAAQ